MEGEIGTPRQLSRPQSARGRHKVKLSIVAGLGAKLLGLFKNTTKPKPQLRGKSEPEEKQQRWAEPAASTQFHLCPNTAADDSPTPSHLALFQTRQVEPMMAANLSAAGERDGGKSDWAVAVRGM